MKEKKLTLTCLIIAFGLLFFPLHESRALNYGPYYIPDNNFKAFGSWSYNFTWNGSDWAKAGSPDVMADALIWEIMADSGVVGEKVYVDFDLYCEVFDYWETGSNIDIWDPVNHVGFLFKLGDSTFNNSLGPPPVERIDFTVTVLMETGSFYESYVDFWFNSFNYPEVLNPHDAAVAQVTAWIRAGGIVSDIRPVPEPSSILLFGSGLVGFFWARRKLENRA